MKQPKDFEAREISVRPDTSCLIIAGAGSGKTEQLSRKILSVLAVVDRPEDILAVTFTKKAGSEMRNRIMKYLTLGLSDAPPKEEHLKYTWELARKALKNNDEKNWNLLLNPNRLQVMTIDSFCLQIINAHPVMNNFGSLITPIEISEPLYKQAATSYINRPHEHESTKNKALFVKYLGNNKDRAVNQLTSLMKNRDQWLPYIFNDSLADTIQSSINSLLDEDIDRFFKLTNLSENDIGTYSKIMDKIKCNLSEFYPDKPNPIFEWDRSNKYDTIKNLCLIIFSKSSRTVRKAFNKPSGIDKNMLDEKHTLLELAEKCRDSPSLIERLTTMPSSAMSETDLKTIGIISEALLETYSELKVLFRYSNKMDFLEITQCALDITSTNNISDTLLYLDNKYKHILIDEFQDTSSAHHKLVRNITSEWEMDSNRSLFLVGDPKQSLYLFRSAALGLFIDVKNNGVGDYQLKNLELSVNFRSYKSIVDWVNKVFAEALPQEDDSNVGAASYDYSEPYSNKEIEDSINYRIFDSLEDNNADKEKEAEILVKDVLANLEKHPTETHAILIRSRSYLKQIDFLLREAKCLYTGVDLVKLQERQPIIDLINLTKAFIDKSDTLSWLAILRAPFVGITQIELFKILNHIEQQEVELSDFVLNFKELDTLSQDSTLRLDKLSEFLRKHYKIYLKTKLRYVIESLWFDLKGDSFIEDLQDIDILSYFSLLESSEQFFTLNEWDRFETALEQLYVQANPNANPKIQVMTIHKSKGLEFDNVYIPGMSRSSKSGSTDTLAWLESNNNNKPLFALACKPEYGSEPSPHYEYIKSVIREKERLEMVRLLYVAATRAIKRIYMYGPIGTNPPSKTSMFGFIWAYIDKIYSVVLKDEVEKKTSEDSIAPLTADSLILENNSSIDENESTTSEILGLENFKNPCYPNAYNLLRYKIDE